MIKSNKCRQYQLIDSIMQSIAAHQGRNGMIFVLLPDVNAAVYNRVKHVGDILLGIHTVCSLDTKAAKERGKDQYLTNIALKVSCKLLGVNQSLDVSSLGSLVKASRWWLALMVPFPPQAPSRLLQASLL